MHDVRAAEPVDVGDRELRIVLQPWSSEHVVLGRLVHPTITDFTDVYVAFTDTRSGQRLARVAIPSADGRFEMKNRRDVAYDLELVDFESRYAPVRLSAIRPGGDEVVLELVARE
jgi:hypothetical protein